MNNVSEAKNKNQKKRIFEVKIDDNLVGKWKEYYFLGKKIYTKLVCLYRYV